MTVIHIYSDGASWGNPGPAGAGAVLKDETGKRLSEVSQYLGRLTNNQAEYMALIAGLRSAERLKPDRLVLHLDSELVIRQLNGRYRVKNPNMLPLYQEARELLGRFRDVEITYIPGENNDEAHGLAGAAVTREMKAQKAAGSGGPGG